MIEPAGLMRLAITKARAGMASGQAPFGCAIARAGEVVAVEHNTVWATTDVTAHAEIIAIRSACRRLDQVLLEECIVATTCEPCPMCMSALHWARVETVYFGATIGDAEAAGFNELSLPAAELLKLGGSPVRLVPHVMQMECAALFDEWNGLGNRPY